MTAFHDGAASGPKPRALAGAWSSAAGLALLALAACGTDAARTEPPNVPPTPGDPPATAAPPAASAAEAPPPPSSSTAAPERVERQTVELGPWQGELLPLVAQHVARAKSQGLTPFVEFSADWCPPCKALKRYWNDPRMAAAFKGTYIIVLNVDDWQDKLKGTGYVPKTIPVFYGVDDQGKPTGRKVTGDDWAARKPEDPPPPKPEPGKPRILPNRDTPDRMAPVLQQFFALR